MGGKDSRVPRSSRASYLVNVLPNKGPCLKQEGFPYGYCGILVYISTHTQKYKKKERGGRRKGMERGSGGVEGRKRGTETLSASPHLAPKVMETWSPPTFFMKELNASYA